MQSDAGYRPDIDGLRAVAVLAVIVFHAFPGQLPGGYVGVDVFFVISGYLISNQLLADTSNGTLSFVSFYARRIRRIFPALIVVLTAVTVAGWWLLMPDEWVELRRHVGASAIFANNIALWSEAGYFDRAAESKPLLHLWSLGVEEQFYLIWPLLIWWCWRRQWRWTALITAVVLISFIVNVATVGRDAVSTAFFLPHTRLWQLASGALLAALARDGFAIRPRLVNAVSVGGTLVILGTFATLASGDVSSYPGWRAVAPTLGTVLVIAAGSGALLNRTVLSARPMVAVGLISYPLYLWHWPILSYLHITEQGEVPPRLKVMAIGASVLLASLTYFCLERPARRRLTPPTVRRMEPLWIPLAAIGLVVVVMITTGWLTPPARTALEMDVRVRGDLNASLCRRRFPDLGEYCQQFNPDWPVTTALLGDSHAAHFMPGLGRSLSAKFETLVHLGQTGCPPLVGIERLKAAGDNSCTRVNRAMIDAVLADRAIVNVWLSFRGARAVNGTDVDGVPPTDLFRIAGGTAVNAAAIGEAMRATIQALQAGGKKVGVLLQVPELGFPPDQCTGRPYSVSQAAARNPCAISRSMVMARQSGYRNLVGDMRREFGITVYDPLESMCDEDYCYGVAEGRLLYVDGDHLGVFGSSWALRGFPR
jgi:peptidoglycan/LPS O-acetylase OafA/YrhL